MRMDDDGKLDLDGDGVPDEVQECEAVLWEFHDLIFVLFMYYASLGSKDPNASVIEYPMWVKFLDDFALYDKNSKRNKKSDLDRIFMQVDSLAAAALKADPERKAQGGFHDDQIKALSRQEFIATIVMIAGNRYVQTGKMRDVSEAVHRLMAEDILPNVDPNIFVVSNVFRGHCYTEGCTKALSKREAQLKMIFEGLNKGQRGKEAQLLCLEEWKGFVVGLDFLGPDLTKRDAALCFVFSRCCVVDARNEKGQLKEINLPFEGFLECICRLAVLKALPTHAEIEAAGCSDAGAYQIKLKHESPHGYRRFLEERATRWGEEPKQPVAVCVEHLLTVIIRQIEDVTRGNDDLQLTQGEVDQWIKERIHDKGLLLRIR